MANPYELVHLDFANREGLVKFNEVREIRHNLSLRYLAAFSMAKPHCYISSVAAFNSSLENPYFQQRPAANTLLGICQLSKRQTPLKAAITSPSRDFGSTCDK